MHIYMECTYIKVVISKLNKTVDFNQKKIHRVAEWSLGVENNKENKVDTNDVIRSFP